MLIFALGLAVACQTAPPTMSLEEAKQVTATFSGTFVPPPRTITDVKQLLEPTLFGGWVLKDARTQADYPDPDPDPAFMTIRDAAWRYLARGRAARRIGRFGQAIDDLTRASTLVTMDMRLKLPGVYQGWNADFGTEIVRELIATQTAAGRYWQARTTAETALAAAQRLRMQGSGFAFRTYLVELYGLTGDLNTADRFVAEQNAEYQQSFGWTWPVAEQRAGFETEVASSRAINLDLRGRHTEAERQWRAALAPLIRFESDYGTGALLDRPWGRLALCLLKQGRLLEAEIEARKALRSAVNRMGFSWEVTTLTNVLAQVLRAQGRYAEARELAGTAIDLFERGGATSQGSPPVIAPRLETAALLAAEGRWAAARDEYALARKHLDDDLLYAQLTQRDSTLSFVLLRAGQIAEADVVLSAALEQSQRTRGEKHPGTAELRGLGAIALTARGDGSTARKEFAEAATVLLSTAEHVDDESTSQGEQGQRRTWILAEYIELLTRPRSPGAAADDGNAVAEAFRIADGARGGIVQRALGAAIARSAAATPALGDLARREQDAAKQISGLQGLLATIGDGAKDAEADLRRRIEALQRARQVLVREIEQKFPAYTELINPRPATIERARAALRPGEALLATYVDEERTYVWAVPKSGPVAFAVVPLGASAIGASVATLRKALDSGARTLQDIPAFDVNIAHDLYRQILEPVKAGWESASSLIVVAHGPLTQIPWTLLPTRAVPLGPERAPLFSNYRAIPWLVRTHAVTVVPSVATLAALRALPPGDPQRRPFIGFGDPYFSVAHARRGSAERVAALSARGGLTLRDVAVSPGADVQESRLAMLPPLPDTADEIRAIARVLGADEARDVFLGIAANERNVRTLELSRYRVIAFATHGLVPGDIDGLTQPALALTAPEVAKVDGDGLLTMEKILALHLNADWVVLSACNTANGAGAGAEAISGLGRAFFYAGARALLVTLWPVETTSAKAMTTEIFRRQAADATLTRAKALQQTINAMIDDGGLIDPSTGRMAFSYAHPLFWAPFVLVGDGG